MQHRAKVAQHFTQGGLYTGNVARQQQRAAKTVKKANAHRCGLGGNVGGGNIGAGLARRLEKAQKGNLGDVKSISDGVFEMREHFGPGWRMYYVRRGDVLIVMLGGGDKSTQPADIAKAMRLASLLED